MKTILKYNQCLQMKALTTMLLLICATSCEDFVQIDSPRTDLTRSTVFQNDGTANAAMLDIYYNMHYQGFASGDTRSLSYLGSISADEQIDYTTGGLGLVTRPFFTHTLTPADQAIVSSWSQLYSWIYKCNAILEGLQASTEVSDGLKKQLEGEAKFVRAFAHFYLVNLWGDVPIILSTDYEENRNAVRQPVEQVYQQITQDLKDAQQLLREDYSASANERTRPNKWAATALLARTYLHIGDWVNAELEASSVIGQSALYNLQADINNVFLKNNPEAIWQFVCTSVNLPLDRGTFNIVGTTPTQGALRTDLVNAFEAGDKRRTDWIGSVTGTEGTYYFSSKYSSETPLAEYSTVLRLAEQYLIRAEARAQQDHIIGAQQDINAIRSRVNLANTNASDKVTLLTAIALERRFELFTEWGHRWIDLKRIGAIGTVLSPIKPEWRPEAALFPIPEPQILNSDVEQNPGY